MGDRYRDNQNALQQSDESVRVLQAQIAGLSQVEAQIRQHTSRLAQLNSQVEMLEKRRSTWETQQAARLGEVQTSLESETYALRGAPAAGRDRRGTEKDRLRCSRARCTPPG